MVRGALHVCGGPSFVCVCLHHTLVLVCGGVLVSRTLGGGVSSPLLSLASRFGMGLGVSLVLCPPQNCLSNHPTHTHCLCVDTLLFVRVLFGVGVGFGLNGGLYSDRLINTFCVVCKCFCSSPNINHSHSGFVCFVCFSVGRLVPVSF